MEVKRKTRVGRVVSNKMNKTVVVEVTTSKHHPLYKKTMRRFAKYKAHDENNQCNEGDIVRIIETRPLSREKRWRVAEIVTRKEVAEVQPGDIS
ncbi:30S ribosomal protein S17 [Chloroflexota bacterium]